jgi:hypothetical protein
LDRRFALNLQRDVVHQPPPQLNQQAAELGRVNVIRDRPHWVAGPSAAAKVRQWRWTLLPGFTSPLGRPFVLQHELLGTERPQRVVH